MGKLSIGIDFDHTIVNGDTPLPGARDALIRLKDLGYHIIIHSCNDAMWIATVLRAHDIPYDLVWDSELNRGKPICAAYVDDRGVGFDGDWNKAVEEIQNIEQRRANIPGTRGWREANASAETGEE